MQSLEKLGICHSIEIPIKMARALDSFLQIKNMRNMSLRLLKN
jgi:hypothetical protein